jgi:hypothetical protein
MRDPTSSIESLTQLRNAVLSKSNVVQFPPKRARSSSAASLADVKTLLEAISRGTLSTSEDFRRALFGLELATHLVQQMIGRIPSEVVPTNLLVQSRCIERELEALRHRILTHAGFSDLYV